MAMKKVEKTMKPIYEVQKEAHEKYLVNPRTFQWYVTKGLLPKARKVGRESFYDVSGDRNVYDYLAVIKLLQNLYGVETDRIKELIGLYEKQLRLLADLLKELAEKYPAGIPLISENWALHKEFLETISGEDSIDLRSIDFEAMKKHVAKKSEIF